MGKPTEMFMRYDAHSSLTRRSVVALAAFGASGLLLPETGVAQGVVKDIRDLKPGEFTWHPERSPEGPVAVVVSIPDQRVHVYRNGVRIAVSTCSTGREGHRTPSGVFTVLEKDRNHRSSTYNNAPMPNMNRLTWSGIALHAGQLPGYPASHGCIRLPLEFSRLLFTVTHVGTPVILANTHTDPAELVHPGLVLDPTAETRLERAVAQLAPRPAQTHEGNNVPPLSILVSSVDRKIVLIESGNQIGEGAAVIRDPDQPLGAHVYVLSAATDGGTVWHGLGHGTDFAARAADLLTLRRISAEPSVRTMLLSRLHVGAILTTVDLPLSADTRSGKDFVIMTEQDNAG
jgi:L,D-transpeptidase catalytic domain